MADGTEQQKADGLPAIQTTEISTPFGPRDITRQFLRKDGRLWNFDPVLSLEAGGDLRQYRDLLRDDHVKATFEQRRSAATAAAWSVQPGDESERAQQAADFVEANLQRIGFDNVTSLMLFAVFYGFSVAEILWDVIDGKFQWRDIRVRDRCRFLFTVEGRCYLNTGQADSEANRIYCESTAENPYFWIVSTGDDFSDNPYGVGLAHQLWWPVRFKRDLMRWWMVYNEKFALPTVVGKYKPGAGAIERTALLAAVANVLTQNGITIPETTLIELLEAKRTGSSDYKSFLTTMDEAISKVIVGQTLTTQVGSSGGNRALGQVHEAVAATLVKSDTDLICESLNHGPIAWLVQRNFGMDCPLPRVKREVEQPVDLTALASQLQILDGIGYRPTLDMVQENWGAEFDDLGPPPDPTQLMPQPGDPALKGKPPAANQPKPKRRAANAARFGALNFAAALPRLFPDQKALDEGLNKLGERMSELSRETLQPIIDYASSTDPQLVLASVAHGLPGWEPKPLSDAVAHVIFVAKTFAKVYPAAA